MDLANQGIDVFNANDAFFNDICQEFDNSNGKDIIIQDRRTDIFYYIKMQLFVKKDVHILE